MQFHLFVYHAKGDRIEKRVTIRLRKDEYDKLNAIASDGEYTLSDLIRKAVDDEFGIKNNVEFIVPVPSGYEEEMMRYLRKFFEKRGIACPEIKYVKP
ncbi:MAG: hypothetical protein QXN59_02845 [Candidatus Micrarchaeaceae archaeon]